VEFPAILEGVSGSVRNSIMGDGAMTRKNPAKSKNSQPVRPQPDSLAERMQPIAAEVEKLSESLIERLEAKMKAAFRQAAQQLMECEPEEIFGSGEFKLRDRMNILTAQIMEEIVNERAKSKKGIPGS
jgi:hypothetical protein